MDCFEYKIFQDLWAANYKSLLVWPLMPLIVCEATLEANAEPLESEDAALAATEGKKARACGKDWLEPKGSAKHCLELS